MVFDRNSRRNLTQPEGKMAICWHSLGSLFIDTVLSKTCFGSEYPPTYFLYNKLFLFELMLTYYKWGESLLHRRPEPHLFAPNLLQ